MTKYVGVSTLEILKEAKNYNQWIADEIRPNVTSPALEIGSGTGNLTDKFLKIKKFYISDIDKGLTSNLKKKYKPNKNIAVKNLDITKRIPSGFNNFFKSIFAVNVLEHIKDDELALKNIYKMLTQRGKLILLVPAKRFAFTRLDRDLGHFRRYEKEELIQKLQSTGFKIEKIYFFNIVGLFSWYMRDKIKRNNFNLKSYHITLFDSIVPILKKIESFINIPIGISLIVVARKVKKVS